jgi:hypothetical protein
VSVTGISTRNSSPPNRPSRSVRADRLPGGGAEAAQHLVADQVAALVVDALEEVDVEQRHGERHAGAAHALALLAHRGHDRAAVHHRGQVVAAGEPLDLGQRDGELGALLVQLGAQVGTVLAEEGEPRQHHREPEAADGALRRGGHRQGDALAEQGDHEAHRQGERGRAEDDGAELHPQRAEREDDEAAHHQRHADLRRPEQEGHRQRRVGDHLLHHQVMVPGALRQVAVEHEMGAGAEQQPRREIGRRHLPGNHPDAK